jgi:tetratricopeptide (TPR) repeat protein
MALVSASSIWSDVTVSIARLQEQPDDTVRLDAAVWAVQEVLGDSAVSVPPPVAEEVDRLVRAFVRITVHEQRGLRAATRLVRAFVEPPNTAGGNDSAAPLDSHALSGLGANELGLRAPSTGRSLVSTGDGFQPATPGVGTASSAPQPQPVQLPAALKACVPPHQAARHLLSILRVASGAIAKFAAVGIQLCIQADTSAGTASQLMREFVHKEVSDAVERLQVQGHVKNPKKEHVSTAYAAMLLLHAVLTSSSPDLALPFRSKALALARLSCGFPDAEVREAGYACLRALLGASSTAPPAAPGSRGSNTISTAALGLNRSSATSGNTGPVADLLAQVLTDFRQPDRVGEHGLCGLILASSALVELLTDKQKIAGVLSAVTQAARQSNSALVKATFVAEAGVFASADPDLTRVESYISAVLEPLVSSRRLNQNRADFAHLARFIATTHGSERCLGRHAANVEAVLTRALQMKPAPTEAWDVAAALASTNKLRAIALVPKILPTLSSEELSPSLSRALECLADAAPKQASELRRKLAALLDKALHGANPQLQGDEEEGLKKQHSTSGVLSGLFSRLTKDPSPSSPTELSQCERALHALELLPMLQVASDNAVSVISNAVLPLIDSPEPAIPLAAVRAVALRCAQCASDPSVAHHTEALKTAVSVALRRAVYDVDMLTRYRMLASFMQAGAIGHSRPASQLVSPNRPTPNASLLPHGGSPISVLTPTSTTGATSTTTPIPMQAGGTPPPPGRSTVDAPAGNIFALMVDKRSLGYLSSTLLDRPRVKQVGLALLAETLKEAKRFESGSAEVVGIVQALASKIRVAIAQLAAELENPTEGLARSCAEVTSLLRVGPEMFAPFLSPLLSCALRALSSSLPSYNSTSTPRLPGSASHQIITCAAEALSLYRSTDAVITNTMPVIRNVFIATVQAVLSPVISSDTRRSLVVLLDLLLRIDPTARIISIIDSVTAHAATDVLRRELHSLSPHDVTASALTSCLGVLAVHRVCGQTLAYHRATGVAETMMRSSHPSTYAFRTRHFSDHASNHSANTMTHGDRLANNDTFALISRLSTEGVFEPLEYVLPSLLSIITSNRNEGVVALCLSSIAAVVIHDIELRPDTGEAVAFMVAFAGDMIPHATDPALIEDTLQACAAAVEHRRGGDLVERLLRDAATLINAAWHPQATYFPALIEFIAALRLGDQTEAAVRAAMPTLLPKLAQVITSDTSNNHLVTSSIIALFRQWDSLGPDVIAVAMPCLLNVIASSSVPVRCRVEALSAAMDLVIAAKSVPGIAPLLHVVRTSLGTRGFEGCHAQVMNLLDGLQRVFPVARAPVRSVMAFAELTNESRSDGQPSSITSPLTGNSPFPVSGHSSPHQRAVATGRWALTGAERAADLTLLQNELSGMTPDVLASWDSDAWRRWYSSFSRICVSASPSVALRACSGLVERYAPLRSMLFAPALMSHSLQLPCSQTRVLDSFVLGAIRSGIDEIVAGFLAYLDLSDIYGAEIQSLPSSSPATVVGGGGLGGGRGGYFTTRNRFTNLSDAFAEMSTSHGFSPAQATQGGGLGMRGRLGQLSAAASNGELSGNDGAIGFPTPTSGQPPSLNSAVVTRTALTVYTRFPSDQLIRSAMDSSCSAHAVRFAEVACEAERTADRVHWLASAFNLAGEKAAALGQLGETAASDSPPLLHELMNDWTAAARAYRLVLDDNPLENGAHRNLVRCLVYSGDFAGAVQSARGSFGFVPLDADMAELAAGAAVLLGAWDQLEVLAPALSQRTPWATVLRTISRVMTTNFENGDTALAALQDIVRTARRDIAVFMSTAAGDIAAHEEHLMLLNTVEGIALTRAVRALRSASCGAGDVSPDVFPSSMLAAILGDRSAVGNRTDPDKDIAIAIPTHSTPLLLPMALSIASTVLPVDQLRPAWLYCALHTRSAYPGVAKWAIQHVGEPEGDHSVAFGLARYLWGQGNHQEAVDLIRNHTKSHLAPHPPNTDWAGAHLTLNRWLRELRPNDWWHKERRGEILHAVQIAVTYSSGGNSGGLDAAVWRNFALYHFRLQQYDSNITPAERAIHVEKASIAFVNAVCFDPNGGGIATLPDTLRLLQLWSLYAAGSAAVDIAIGCVDRVPVACWALIAPQLVAQLSAESSEVRNIALHALRCSIEFNIDAVVFPLWMAAGIEDAIDDSNSLSTIACDERNNRTVQTLPAAAAAARSVLDACTNRVVVNDAKALVMGLDDASTTLSERVYHAMSAILEAMNKEIPEEAKKSREGLRGISENVLAGARKEVLKQPAYAALLERFKRLSKHMIDDNWAEARALTSRIYEDAKKESEGIHKLALSRFAKRLHGRSFDVAAFGEVDAQNPRHRCTIAAFEEGIDVISSKRKPRRIALSGSDGKRRRYLLKAYEDLRVDERVMQLFRLVNSSLGSADQGHAIVTYVVVPLLPTLGVIGWIEGCETVLRAIETHRSVAKIAVDEEHQRCSEEWPYANAFMLTKPQREELYEWTLSGCQSIDLARVLWLRCRSSSTWLACRSVYTKSLALNSMVGYVVGLGDRHLGNLMLLGSSGSIAHIDFGDCFDRARLRNVFPETVPFRLTRMMTRAMELSGTRGTFSAAAESALSLLRASRDSIVGLLGALVHDPTFDASALITVVTTETDAREALVETIRGKLRGADDIRSAVPFKQRQQNVGEGLTVAAHVAALTHEATKLSNISDLFQGWCPLW